MKVTILFANLGRGPVAKVKQSWASLAAHAGDVDVFCPVEVDEGDKGYSDHSLMRHDFPASKWTATPNDWRKVHEPILTRTGLPVLRSRRVWAGVSVHRQTPRRGITSVLVDGENVSPACEVDSTHFTTHAHNGTGVPAKLRDLLTRLSWLPLQLKLSRRAHRAHARGHHWIGVADTNDHGYDITAVHPKAVPLFHDGPDIGFVVPAPGWAARSKHTTVPTFVEPFHKVVVEFTKEKP